MLIDVLVDQARREDAIAVLRQTLELRRAPGRMRLRLASLLAEAGETEQAIEVAQALLALEPQNAQASALLARLATPAEGADQDAPMARE